VKGKEVHTENTSEYELDLSTLKWSLILG
jgi:hypothetical protein